MLRQGAPWHHGNILGEESQPVPFPCSLSVGTNGVLWHSEALTGVATRRKEEPGKLKLALGFVFVFPSRALWPYKQASICQLPFVADHGFYWESQDQVCPEFWCPPASLCCSYPAIKKGLIMPRDCKRVNSS